MGIRIDPDLFKSIRLFTRQRVKFRNPLKLFAKERQAPSAVFKVGRKDFEAVAPHSKRAALKRLIIAPVLLRYQIRHDLSLVIVLAHDQILRHGRICLDRADAVDTADRGYDDHIVPLKQRTGRRVAHAVDLFVNLALFFDVGVRPRHIGFGLIIVIERHEIFDRVLGKEAFEFAIKLGGQRFVGGKDDRGTLRFLDDLSHREGFAGARCTQKDLITLAIKNTLAQFGNRGWLITGRVKFGCHDELFSALKLLAWGGLNRVAVGIGVGQMALLFLRPTCAIFVPRCKCAVGIPRG